MNINALNSVKEFAERKMIHTNSNKINAKFHIGNSQKSSQSGGIVLHKDGLASYGNADGENITIYKSDNYSEENPEFKIVTTFSDGQKKEQFIDPREIDPSNANTSEIFALHTYLVSEGKMETEISHTSIMAGSAGMLETKMNYMSIIKELMMMQYHAHNLKGYAEYNEILGVYDSFLDFARI